MTSDDLGSHDDGCAKHEVRPFQFTLRHLMYWVAAVSLLAAVWSWDGNPASWAPEGFLVIGLCLFAAGVYVRRRMVVVLGLATLLAIPINLGNFRARPENRSDLRPVAIDFQVVDDRTGKPIPGATVSLLTEITEHGTADANGSVLLKGYFSRYAYNKSFLCGAGYKVKVVANGYAILQVQLEERTHDRVLKMR